MPPPHDTEHSPHASAVHPNAASGAAVGAAVGVADGAADADGASVHGGEMHSRKASGASPSQAPAASAAFDESRQSTARHLIPAPHDAEHAAHAAACQRGTEHGPVNL